MLYAFDPRRAAYLLLGGDKTGHGGWYEINVPRAEAIYVEHLREIEKAPRRLSATGGKTMATKWSDLKHKTSPEKREWLKREALVELEALERSGMGLLRTTRRQTQVAVAEQMKIPQSAVSRIERQRDCRLSTLHRYVAALGGRLEMRAVFPDDTVDLSNFMDAPEAVQGTS